MSHLRFVQKHHSTALFFPWHRIFIPALIIGTVFTSYSATAIVSSEATADPTVISDSSTSDSIALSGAASIPAATLPAPTQTLVDSSLTDSVCPPGPVVSPSATVNARKPQFPDPPFAGINLRQDSLARRYIRRIYGYNWHEAEQTFKKLQRFERKHKLLPLSGLLGVSAGTIRILGGEFSSEEERKLLFNEISDLRKKTLRQLDNTDLPDSLEPLALFISGGVKGLFATLKIETAIVQAAIEGFDALGKLEKVVELSPGQSDPFLGLGIFYCLLARSPGIVRAALNLTGRAISFDKGLDYLRRSALRGRYTSETAMLYLVRFLSPYWGHLAKEKNTLLRELEDRYPGNPHYTFLRLDEAICFHPQTLPTIDTAEIIRKSGSWNQENFSQRRYALLATMQLDFIAGREISVPTDTNADLHEFSFYPLFLSALAQRRSPADTGSERPTGGTFTETESAALRTLGLSSMSTTLRNFYEWHIRDALKLLP